MIDLRSDTVTKPTAAMREAMVSAPVGDDVLGDDPTVPRLEATLAEMLGKPAAVFVPTGTMSNQLGVRAHCQAGDEFICDSECHIHNYEQAAHTQLFGVAARPLVTRHGVPTAEQLASAVWPDNIHFPRTRLLCLENTHNRMGGRMASLDEARAACDAAAEHGLARHLDGARLWNAVVASGNPWREELLAWGGLFDTVSVCMSKGLGAPIGSALVGPEEAIQAARRTRKALGGGWRQAGMLAAGALYALEHNVERLADDHRRAQLLASAVRETNCLSLVDDRCDTNLVLIDIDPAFGTAAEVAGRLAHRDVHVFPIGAQRLRAVTHLDLTDDQASHAASQLQQAVTDRSAPSVPMMSY